MEYSFSWKRTHLLNTHPGRIFDCYSTRNYKNNQIREENKGEKEILLYVFAVCMATNCMRKKDCWQNWLQMLTVKHTVKKPSPFFELFKFMESLVSQKAHIYVIIHLQFYNWKVSLWKINVPGFDKNNNKHIHG